MLESFKYVFIICELYLIEVQSAASLLSAKIAEFKTWLQSIQILLNECLSKLNSNYLDFLIKIDVQKCGPGSREL